MDKKAKEAAKDFSKNASEKAKNASEKAAVFMRSFREKANKAADQGTHMSVRLMAQMRSKAQSMNNAYYQGIKRDNSQASQSAPSQPSRKSISSPHKLPKGQAAPVNVPAFVSASAAAYMAEDEKVRSLCALGFAPPVVRHALRRCGGRVEEAGVWLLDEAHSDERLAAEMDLAKAGRLAEGSLARVNGLRGASHLNGLPVVLQFWDVDAERWVVQMPDGSAKSIRPRNLDHLDDEAAALAAAEMENAMHYATPQMGKAPAAPVFPPPKGASEYRGEDIDAEALALATAQEEEALRMQVRDMLGLEAGAEADECLKALSVQELLEVVQSLPDQATVARAAPVSGEPMACCGPASPTEVAAERQRVADLLGAQDEVPIAPAPPTTQAQVASAAVPAPEKGVSSAAIATLQEDVDLAPSEPKGAASELLELERRLKESTGKMAAWEAQQRVQQEAMEAREAAIEAREEELLESQARWRGEAEQKAEQIHLLESGEASQHQASAEAICSLQSERSRESELEEERRETAKRRLSLEEQRVELAVLQEKAERAAKDLEERQAAQRQAAEDRELRLLEQEAEQLRIGSALREEQERLENQRRAVFLLQQSLIERQNSTPGSTLTSAEGGAQGACIEMSLDDSACTAVEEAAPEAVDLSLEAKNEDAIVFKPPRRSLSSKTRPEANSGGIGEATFSEIESAVGPAASPSEDVADEEEESGEEDDDEEVWDLDWSMVETKLRRASEHSESSASPVAVKAAAMPIDPEVLAPEAGVGSTSVATTVVANDAIVDTPAEPPAISEATNEDALVFEAPAAQPAMSEATIDDAAVLEASANPAGAVADTVELHGPPAASPSEAHTAESAMAVTEVHSADTTTDSAKVAMQEKLAARRELVEAQEAQEKT